MKMSKYLEHNMPLIQPGRLPLLPQLWSEICELLAAHSWNNVKEELGDVIHLLQIMLLPWFGLDTNVWMWCAAKYIRRQKVWQKIYEAAGLHQPARIAANYEKYVKVRAHLSAIGVDEETSWNAWLAVVHPECSPSAVK